VCPSVRPSPSAHRKNARTLPNPSAWLSGSLSPDPCLLCSLDTHYCCISPHSPHCFSLYRIIVRRRRRTNGVMWDVERRERRGRAYKGRGSHSDGTSFSRSGSCCGPKHKTTQSNIINELHFINTHLLFTVSHLFSSITLYCSFYQSIDFCECV